MPQKLKFKNTNASKPKKATKTKKSSKTSKQSKQKNTTKTKKSSKPNKPSKQKNTTKTKKSSKSNKPNKAIKTTNTTIKIPIGYCDATILDDNEPDDPCNFYKNENECHNEAQDSDYWRSYKCRWKQYKN